MTKYRKLVFTIGWLLVIFPFLVYFYIKILKWPEDIYIYKNKTMTQLIVKSPYFTDWWIIPSEFTCDWQDLFPTIEVWNIPAEATNLILYVEDPDAPMERPFIHLMAVNIPVDSWTKLIDQQVLESEAVLWINDFGNLWWNGPCPPHWHGVHHYYFKVLAFANELPLSSWFTISEFVKAISSYQGYIVGSGELIGLYQR